MRVDWGSASETPLKIAVLSALRASPAAAGATVIDVSAPRLPITEVTAGEIRRQVPTRAARSLIEVPGGT